ncbi:MAG TPA: peptidoglycan DD-metalloendopeptidase family protein [Candidatus Acidoferrum sp.]|nr:peptidoglycan DD-metalloendopeptidase family protein [Candidatus Acidoferrum sp.]
MPRSERSATRLAATLAGIALIAGAALPAPAADRLKDVQEAIQDEQDRVQYLGLQAEQLAAEITRLQGELVTAARDVQDREDELGKLEKRLDALQSLEREKTEALAAQRGDMSALLGALQRLSAEPRETLVLGWRSPMDTVITAQLLRFAVPPIEAKVQRLRQDLDDIAQLRAQALHQRQEIAAATEQLKGARASLEELVALKSGLRQTTDAERAAAAERVRALTNQADDLRELLNALPPTPSKGATGLAATLRLEPPKDLKSFPTKQVGLTPPVRGTLVIQFDQPKEDGSISQGVVFETAPEAQIVAPLDGQVLFRGPFRGYGQILLMEHRGGYHTLLAGLGRIDVVEGQWLLTGEPVGITESPKEGKARLYMEVRRNGRPFDPWPWLEARISKVE